MQSGVDNRSAATATGCTGKRVVKPNTLSCKFINIGGLDRLFAVATKHTSQIIGNEKQYVSGHELSTQTGWLVCRLSGLPLMSKQ
jgi:hypothetical protein